MRRLLPGAVAALVAATYGLAVAPPSASAGVPYKVLKCHYWHQDADEVDSAGNHNSYIAINDCNASSTDRKLGIVNRGNAGNTAYKQWMFSARSGTKFDSVCLDYKLRRDNHHRAEILSYPGFAVLASGGDGRLVLDQPLLHARRRFADDRPPRMFRARRLRVLRYRARVHPERGAAGHGHDSRRALLSSGSLLGSGLAARCAAAAIRRLGSGLGRLPPVASVNGVEVETDDEPVPDWRPRLAVFVPARSLSLRVRAAERDA